ncbi:hypothetical protein BV25DRAFT_1830074 [Artomyces pyxidatus]|uniref:Uncharacterized protein n=1 Tax=Artomyces pyxidatus TaxID=48021 RepID=A0ACB8SPX7_9AGAM|nr:hypothetical protein BV25DRAFT_1830074 [Artomyces pyxidatus]
MSANPDDNDSSSPSGSHSHPQNGQRPPQPPPPPRPILPSIKLSIPRKGHLSSATSERCFTYCTQTHRGRAERREPHCRTFCIRRIFAHEVNRTLADAGFHPFLPPPATTSVPIDIPLSPEADTSAAEFFAGQTPPEGQSNPETGAKRAHWREGYYLWLSQTRLGAFEHMTHMKRDLEEQHAYEQGKAAWERAIREGREREFLADVNGRLVGDAWRDEVYADILTPPSTNLLIPLSTPAPQLQQLLGKYLAPTQRLLTLTQTSFTSGAQAVLLERMQNAVMTAAPFTLAGTVSKKMWRLLWGEGDGEER